MSFLADLSQWFKTKPLVLLQFPKGIEQAILESKCGLERFSFAKPHGAFHELRLPTLCLVEMHDGPTRRCYVGVAKTKAAITTLDSRIMVIKLQSLNLKSMKAIKSKLANKSFQTSFNHKLANPYLAQGLPPKLSVAIIDALTADPHDKEAIEAATFHIPNFYKVSETEWEQLDAIQTAMATFGLSKADFPELLKLSVDSDSALNSPDFHAAHVLEDNVIAKDASVIPGFDLVEKHVTGRAVFFNNGEQLDVYTANKGPLEEMLGVDLIYVNETMGNTVMIQYKMLEQYAEPGTVKTDWIFRPDDQFQRELARMKLPPLAAKVDDYRLCPSPFFFKFVKRKGDGETHASMVISLDHLNQFLSSSKSKGPKGGVCVSFESFDGVYLRERDLLGLIRSGYIGTHRMETNALKPIIQEVSEGKRALVLAWQKRVQSATKASDQ